jgi:hypothetical protein
MVPTGVAMVQPLVYSKAAGAQHRLLADTPTPGLPAPRLRRR